MELKIEKGPQEVMRSLLSGDPEQVKEAMEFQLESFKARWGCYPSELICANCEQKYSECMGLCDE